ncbi:MAG: acyl-CoA thioesterase [Chthoniobacterales bacterium]|nr:acyl-CoA thioesterase [Chthoniobacterales bacterium]
MFFDTDVGGATHNTAYLRFIETARTLFAVELGLDWKGMQNTSIFPVILRTEIDYRRAALVGDKLEVHSWLGEITAARFWCHFKIMRPADEVLIATCQQSLSFVQMPEGKPLRLPRGFPTPFLPTPKK